MRKIFSLSNFTIYFITIICIRVTAMYFVPLTDTTEARYGEIARKMVEMNDWVTPYYDYGVPFWAKPPLSTWLSALSIKIFGLNELSVRFPSLLFSFAILTLIWQFIKPYLENPICRLVIIILTSMSLFYFAEGMVMTDMSLVFATTLTIISFWFAVEVGNRKWGYVFFGGLGICMLSKGPAAVVLGMLPIFFWLVWTKNWRKMWNSLPWFTGSLLMVAIFLPWYVMAEIKTPGFIQYFIVGEHIDRFLISGWKGDLYGNAHNQPVGMIWVFLVVDSLPWIFIVLPWAIYNKYKNQSESKAFSSHDKFVWCWLISPMVFFSFAHNIIYTYCITALPPLAILISKSIAPLAIKKEKIHTWVYLTGLIMPVVLVIIGITSTINPELGKKSARNITRLFQSNYTSQNTLLSYVGKRLYSMEFYNEGKVNHYESINDAFASLKANNKMYIALTNVQVKSLTKAQKDLIKLKSSTKHYHLYEASLGLHR